MNRYNKKINMDLFHSYALPQFGLYFNDFV